MKIKYIFFDFDGVLAESVNVKTEAFRKMYLFYGETFAQKVVEHHEANGGISRFEKFKIYHGSWLNQEITDEKIKLLSDEFSNLVMDGVVSAPEVPGTTSFLLHSQNFKKFIITGTPTTEMKTIILKRKMSKYFIDIYGSPEKKDYWVKQILKCHGILPEECVFVGDAITDYDAAMSNGLHFILRETREAENLFREYDGFRIKDLNSLNEVLLTIQ